jgi:hypothetical protein
LQFKEKEKNPFSSVKITLTKDISIFLLLMNVGQKIFKSFCKTLNLNKGHKEFIFACFQLKISQFGIPVSVLKKSAFLITHLTTQ